MADFAILSDNPITIPEDQIADIKVVETIKEGVSIYKRPDNEASISSPATFGITLNEFELPVIHQLSGDQCRVSLNWLNELNTL